MEMMENYSELDSKFQEIKENYEQKLRSRYNEFLNKPNEYRTPINTLRRDFKATINEEKNNLTHYSLDTNSRCQYEIMIKKLAIYRFQNDKLGRYPFNPVKAFIEINWKELKTSTLNEYNKNLAQLKPWQKIEVEFANADIDEVIQLLAIDEAHENVLSFIRDEIENKNIPNEDKNNEDQDNENEDEKLGEIPIYTDFKCYFKEFENIDEFLCDFKKIFKMDIHKKAVLAFYICYLLYEFEIFNFNFLPTKTYDYEYNRTRFTRTFNAYFFDNADYWPQSTLLPNSKFQQLEKYKRRPEFVEYKEKLIKLKEVHLR